jgi:hypothetical protein
VSADQNLLYVGQTIRIVQYVVAEDEGERGEQIRQYVFPLLEAEHDSLSEEVSPPSLGRDPQFDTTALASRDLYGARI